MTIEIYNALIQVSFTLFVIVIGLLMIYCWVKGMRIIFDTIRNYLNSDKSRRL